MSDTWKLYYWAKLAGRGEFVRLMLEDAQANYEYITDASVVGGLAETKGWPIFAMPMIEKGKFRLSQTSAIQRHVGQALGYAPKGANDKARCDQINLTILDFLNEAVIKIQGDDKEEKKKKFVSNRAAKFLKYFENTLEYNKKSGDDVYFIGDSPTWPDFAFLYALQSLEAAYADEFDEIMTEYSKCIVHMQQMKGRPNIESYLQSGRRANLMT